LVSNTVFLGSTVHPLPQIINDTLEKHNLNLDYEINNNLPVPMSYNVSTNTIKFTYLQVNGYISKIRFTETDEGIVRKASFSL
jgi:hypothetical protein